MQPELDGKGEIKVSDINFGKGKYFPGGPTCEFNGKTIDCQVYLSPGGGITAEILVSILKSIDDSGILPRIPGGPIPSMLLDGHQTRLDPLFLAYINDLAHFWFI